MMNADDGGDDDDSDDDDGDDDIKGDLPLGEQAQPMTQVVGNVRACSLFVVNASLVMIMVIAIDV